MTKKVIDIKIDKSNDPDAIENQVLKITGQIKELYQSDNLPWVIGYSGGKDSTACLQLVWNAVLELPEEKKPRVVDIVEIK